MAKVDVDLVKMVLQRNALEDGRVAKILSDINEEIAAQEEEAEMKPPPVKKQFVVIASDPEGVLEGKDLVGWVVQIPEEDSPYVALDRMVRAAYEHNQTPKGRRMSLKTIAEIAEHCTAKALKEQNIWVKTKEPVYLVRTDGGVPMDKTKKLD